MYRAMFPPKSGLHSRNTLPPAAASYPNEHKCADRLKASTEETASDVIQETNDSCAKYFS